MITGEIKSKVDRIWETFWTGGITNPLTVIEQFTYLLFIKSLDEKQLQNEQEAELLGLEPDRIFLEEYNHLRWHNFMQMEAQAMYKVVSEQVFPYIKEINTDKSASFAKYMKNATFNIPTPLLLQKIVDGIDDLLKELGNKNDIKGDLYEYLLSKLATSGTNGQFRTPRHIINMMVELAQPTPADTIIDPACGTSGFLIGANEYLKENHKEIFQSEELKKHFNNEMFHGSDTDETMLRISTMNMMLHDVENPQIIYKDSLSEVNDDEEKYTMVLANPPFKGSLDNDSVADSLLRVTKTKKTELLFLALMLRILKKGGKCAVIVPDGVLFGSSKAHQAIRKEIVENNQLEAVISMPSGVFKPYAGVSTAILFFTKAGRTDDVWFYDMKADGYSLDDKRNPIEDNDIPDIIERFHNRENEKDRKRREQSFFVTKDEIAEQNYDLSINKYKEIEYEEVVYDSTENIVKDIKVLEEQILASLENIEKWVK